MRVTLPRPGPVLPAHDYADDLSHPPHVRAEPDDSTLHPAPVWGQGRQALSVPPLGRRDRTGAASRPGPTRRRDRRAPGRDDRAGCSRRLGPDAELHVIDPVPEFDPDRARATAFPGRYHFHGGSEPRGAARRCPPMDAALIDGDHNWYTVYHELKPARRRRRDADGQPLPVLVLHDVGWPYGRRDLYYAPDQIPEEHRQPYAPARHAAGHERAPPEWRVQPDHAQRGASKAGRRNGVMTALDDFIAEHDRPLRNARAADLLRAGHRRRGGAARSTARRSPPRSTVSRAPTGASELLEVAEDVRAPGDAASSTTRSSSATKQLDAMRRAGTSSTVKASLLDRALPRPTRSGSSTCATASPPGRPRTSTSSATRSATTRSAYRRPRRHRFGRSRPAARPPRAVPALHRRWAASQLDHLERCLDAMRSRRRRRATWSSAAPAEAAGPSSCAPTSTPTSCRDAWCCVADGSAPLPHRSSRRRSPTHGRRRVPRRPQPGPRRLRPLRPPR